MQTNLFKRFAYGVALSSALMTTLAAQGAPLKECENESKPQLNVGAFYRDVLSVVDNSTKEGYFKSYDAIIAFEARAVEVMKERVDPTLITELTLLTHDVGYYKPLIKSQIENPDAIDVGAKLKPEAVAVLSEKGRAAYEARYENFAAKNNKLTVTDLDLTDANMEAFFKAQGKNPDVVIAKLKAKGAKMGAYALLNAFQQSFAEMLAIGKTIKNEASRAKWNTKIFSNQEKAVARKLIIAEIGRLGLADIHAEISAVPSEYSAVDRYFRLEDELTFRMWIYTSQYYGEFGYDGETDRHGNPPGPKDYPGKDARLSLAYQNALNDQDRILDLQINRALDPVLLREPEILLSLTGSRP